MDDSHERIELLLAAADDGLPILEEGLSSQSAGFAPKPKKAVRGDDSPHWRRHDADPNGLAEQRWGLVVPEGREGDQMLEAMTPLIRLREEEQGAKALVYRVPAEMDAKASVAWKEMEYWSEDVSEEERPLYLMMLGDFHQTSLELQHTLANGAIVGRVHFASESGDTDLAGYSAYAEKVCRFARTGKSEPLADLLYYVANDGTTATHIGETRLVAPSLLAAQKAREAGKLAVQEVQTISADTVEELLQAGACERPAVLMSVSHGLGAPRRGFKTEEEQWAKQGAMLVRQGESLTAERMRGQTFLPGGIWFFLACFGAGTPASSVYHTWLSTLAREGTYEGKPNAVLESLPSAGRRPFVAALPQAALANPAGPLAVIGHVDLAWTYGFSGGEGLAESRQARFSSALDVLVRGSRAGVALDALVRFYREANDALLASYQVEADARVQGRDVALDRKTRGHLWMLRNDLRGYILLGDPAARLPLRKNVIQAPGPTPVLTPVVAACGEEGASSVSAACKEAAVIAMLRGDEAPRVIAERAQVSLDVLWTWVDAFRAGGRERLSG